MDLARVGAILDLMRRLRAVFRGEIDPNATEITNWAVMGWTWPFIWVICKAAEHGRGLSG